MGLYTDGVPILLQMMAGGDIYSPDWYISLGHTVSPFNTPASKYEILGTRVPLETDWEADPTFASDTYRDAIQSVDMVEVPTPNAATVVYYMIWNGEAATKWTWYGRVWNYPLATEAGDYVRFLPGALKIIIDY